MKAPSNRLLVVSYGSVTSYSELNCLEFSFCLQNLENSRFCRKNLDCKTVRIFAYSSTREQSNNNKKKVWNEAENRDRGESGVRGSY